MRIGSQRKDREAGGRGSVCATTTSTQAPLSAELEWDWPLSPVPQLLPHSP